MIADPFIWIAVGVIMFLAGYLINRRVGNQLVKDLGYCMQVIGVIVLVIGFILLIFGFL